MHVSTRWHLPAWLSITVSLLGCSAATDPQGNVDGGADGGQSPYAVGSPCSAAGTSHCVGATSRERVTCGSDGKWAAGATCAEAERCDTATGACKAVAPACVGHSAGDSFCAGNKLVRCSSDLLSAEETACPLDKPVCINAQCGECVPGVRSCLGSAVRACGSDGTWTEVEVCAGACNNGVCEVGCKEGEKSCVGKDLKVCQKGVLVTSLTCPFVCSASKCTGICSPGERDCSGNTARVCNSEGQWQEDQRCAAVCQDGKCETACSPIGRKQCSGKSLLECKDDGTYDTKEVCPYVCKDGSCTGSCEPGAAQCKPDGRTQQTCDATGTFQDAALPCEGGCYEGACVTCVPAATRCAGDGKTVETCKADGTGWATSQTCGFACDQGACKGECTTGDTRCVGLERQTCTNSAWTRAETCSFVCKAPSRGSPAACAGVCAPNTTKCENAKSYTCDTNGAWGPGVDCAGRSSECQGATFVTYTPACSVDGKMCAAPTPNSTTCSASGGTCLGIASFTPYYAVCNPTTGCSTQAGSTQTCTTPATTCTSATTLTNYTATCSTSSGCGTAVAGSYECPSGASSCNSGVLTSYPGSCQAGTGCTTTQKVEPCAVNTATCDPWFSDWSFTSYIAACESGSACKSGGSANTAYCYPRFACVGATLNRYNSTCSTSSGCGDTGNVDWSTTCPSAQACNSTRGDCGGP